jgi:hypothetical protein
MKPTVADSLLCILENLEELVFPTLTEEHALSVARCTSILLRVALLRLADESRILAEDSAEKRRLFAWLNSELSHDTPQRLAELLSEMNAAAREHPLIPVALDTLSDENAHLKDILERVVIELHAERATLGEPRFSALQKRVREQLRDQIAN